MQPELLTVVKVCMYHYYHMALVEECNTNYIIIFTMYRQSNGDEQHGHYKRSVKLFFFLLRTTTIEIVVDTSYTFLLASFSPLSFSLAFRPYFF